MTVKIIILPMVNIRLRVQEIACITLGVDEMNDGLILEDVNLFNARNGVHSKPLQSVLQPLVISSSGFVYGFFLSAKIRGYQHI